MNWIKSLIRMYVCSLIGHKWGEEYNWGGRFYRDCARCYSIDFVSRNKEMGND